MKLGKDTAEIFVPDNLPIEEALPRTTHMGISAHQDDIEIMATHGVLQCFGLPEKWFMGVVVTNGAGSPRDDLYAAYDDDMMQKIRRLEQQKAAIVGEYSAQALLNYSSSEVKDAKNQDTINDLANIIKTAKPEVIYTHNLADKHDTHVSTALRVIAAIRTLDKADRPKKLYGGEVWRALDWLNDDDKVILDVSAHENIAMALLGVFDSQICGGKRYDLASQGRRRANATYFASHGTDEYALLNFGMDMTPLIEDDSIDPEEYLMKFVNNFINEIKGRVGKFK